MEIFVVASVYDDKYAETSVLSGTTINWHQDGTQTCVPLVTVQSLWGAVLSAHAVTPAIATTTAASIERQSIEMPH
jgi:hypothetical protein